MSVLEYRYMICSKQVLPKISAMYRYTHSHIMGKHIHCHLLYCYDFVIQPKTFEIVTMQPPQMISKEIIKPSSPTPDHLRYFNLSLLDQVCPNIYLPMFFLYPKIGDDRLNHMNEITNILKKALSETLALYYPFAGRNGSRGVIECNDEGVEFYVTRMDCNLSEVEKLDLQTIDLFYPNGVLWNESYQGSLLVIQLTFFNCGAMAISKCMSHKLADGGTSISFVTDWASMARNSGFNLPPPHFVSNSLVPPNDPPIIKEITRIQKTDNCVTQIFVFDASKLSDLKALVAKSGVSNPSRVEVVSALIYKCLIAANIKAKGPSSKPYFFMQPVNLRPKTVPPMPSNTLGNFSWFSAVMVKNEDEKEVHHLVAAIKNGMAQLNDMFGNNRMASECYATICDIMKLMMSKNMKNESHVYKGSSLCRYPYDDVDFGWGKPISVGTSSSLITNTFLLKDTPEFGIEAWITLENEEMDLFASDLEFLAFATTK